MTFHPDLARAYVVNEIDDTIGVYDHDIAAGQLAQIQLVDTLPIGADPNANSTADIHVDQQGTQLYASNRGHDSLVVHAIDPVTGMLTLVGHADCGGQTPRSFDVVFGVPYLLVANQDSDEVAFFDRLGDGVPVAKGIGLGIASPAVVRTVWLP